MSARARALAAILDAQAEVVRELIDVLQDDQRRVVAQDLEGLEASNRTKETLALRLQHLERERRAAAAALAAELGLPPEGVRVSALCERLGAAAEPLERAAARLRALLESLAELVAVSRGFLEHSLVGIRGLLALVHSLRAPAPPTYDATGRYAAAAAPALAVRREV